MSILAVLTLSSGSLTQGFDTVTLRIWENDHTLSLQMTGALPPAPELMALHRRWQMFYREVCRFRNTALRIDWHAAEITHFSTIEFEQLGRQLTRALNQWLSEDGFRPLERTLCQSCQPEQELRLVVETQSPSVQALPWNLWHVLDTYHEAEVAISALNYRPPQRVRFPRTQVRILGVLGDSQHLDITTDRELIHTLPDATIEWLVEPEVTALDLALRQEQGWDLLFFAGHSSSQAETEQVFLGPRRAISLTQLNPALAIAIERGLQLAIFNSCDGLGLAHALAQLSLPQVIVMREPVPDLVAQTFLREFLAAYSTGLSLYRSVRRSRQALTRMEQQFPCASWLPVLGQNPATIPPAWQDLGRRHPPQVSPYRGVSPYRQKDAGFFRGRQALTQRLVEHVKTQCSVAVVGASASGKTSLVQAGLLPVLRTSGGWQVVFLSCDEPTSQIWLQSLHNQLNWSLTANLSWLTLAQQWRELAADDSLLIVLDGWEASYRPSIDPVERQAGLTGLAQLLKTEGVDGHVVFTLNQTVWPQLQADWGKTGLGRCAYLAVTAPSRAELEAMVLEPAHSMAVTLEDGLPGRLIKAVDTQPSPLVALSLALSELWQHQHQATLTHRAYDTMGGLDSLLVRLANQCYEQLPPAQQVLLPGLLLELTELGDGQEDSPRGVPVATIVARFGPAIEPLLETLIQARILVLMGDQDSNTPSLRVAHETLIRQWSLVGNQLPAVRSSLRQTRRLDALAKEWAAQPKGQQNAYLLRGAQLTSTDLLLKTATPPLQLLPTTLAWLRRSRERRRWRRALMIGLLAGSLGLLTLAWQLNHHRYWRGTIFAVQTVDFNLLAHMLPTKLSLALKAEDSAELQRTLDSNFGLFGLVVTDCPHDRPHCPQQQIVHASRSSHKWRQQLTIDGLADHPYDVLRDPPPLKAEGRYLHPYDDQRQPTGYRNSGRVLGRVYYVRGIPPGVWENVGGRIRGIWAGFWRQPPETESLNSD